MTASLWEAIEKAVEYAGRGMTAELREQLSEVRMQAAALREQLADLREENTRLREQAAVRTSMVHESGLYFREVDGKDRDGPFCPGCYDDKGKQIRLQRSDDGVECCTRCEFRWTPPGWEPPTRYMERG